MIDTECKLAYAKKGIYRLMPPGSSEVLLALNATKSGVPDEAMGSSACGSLIVR